MNRAIRLTKRYAIFSDDLRLQIASVVYEGRDISMPERYIGPPTRTMQSRGDYLNTMERETFTKIIYGEVPIEEFDKFVEDWHGSGGENISKEVNEWYDAVRQ